MNRALILLVGGFGTRLESVSKGIPKALMPVGAGVFLDLLLRRLFKFSIDHVYLSTHYKSQLFFEYIQNSIFKKKISVIVEPDPLGTGGAINYILENAKLASPFFVVNGDSLSDLNLDEMFKEFNKSEMKAMIGISEVSDVSRYGAIEESSGLVISIKEKSFAGSGWINNGHYLFKKEAFEEFNSFFSLEDELLPEIVKNKKCGAFKVLQDTFVDMGIPEDYNKVCTTYST